MLEFLSYEGVFTATTGPAAGLTSTDIGASQTSCRRSAQSLQRNSLGVWARGRLELRRLQPGGADPRRQYAVSSAAACATDPALPVGYEDQFFATLRSPGNVTVPTTITWTSETPAIASIDAKRRDACADGGHGDSCGATAADGTTAIYSLPHARGGGQRRHVSGQHRVR